MTTDEKYAEYRAWCIGRIQEFRANGRNARTSSLTATQRMKKKLKIEFHEAERFLARLRDEGHVAFTAGTWWLR